MVFANDEEDAITCVARSSMPIRLAFLRIVYLIMAIQQFFLAAVSFTFFITPGVRPFVQYYSSTAWLTMVLLLFSVFCLRYAMNYERRWCGLMFFLFTVALAMVCSAVTTFFDTEIVYVVCMINGSIFLAHLLYCVQTLWSLRLQWSAFATICISTLASCFLQSFIVFDTIDIVLQVLFSSIFCIYVHWNISYFTHFLGTRERSLACARVFVSYPKFF